MRPFLAAVVIAIVLSACGSASGGVHPSAGPHTSTGVQAAPKTLDLYSSLPLSGPRGGVGAQMEHGIRLALNQNHNRTRYFRIRYRSLNDGGEDRAWSPRRTLANASRAATDRRTDYYIGELGNAATSLSAQVLSNAGIAQVTAVPGPFNKRPPTLFSLLPGQAIQTSAMAAALKQAGCAHVALVSKAATGAALRSQIQAEIQARHITVSDRSVKDSSAAINQYALKLRNLGADCLVYVGPGIKTAAALVTAVHVQLPHLTVFGTDSVCTSGWPASSPQVLCTYPLMPISNYPGGDVFSADYERAFGATPQSAYALYGYEAARLFIHTVNSLGARGASREALVDKLQSLPERDSVLGSYSFDDDGQATLDYYGLYSITSGGAPRFVRRLDTSQK